jgi:aryl carrier-like protein
VFPVKLVHLILNNVSKSCRILNLYGPAETTIDCTFHYVNATVDTETIPIGASLPNYRNLIMDDFLQPVAIDQEGELFVGGVGVFAGYLGRDDLTEKALITIDDELFYRTGDLVRMDSNGRFHYRGRKDHQIKLHGQRIELGEIERCLLDTFISGCVVIKWGDDHLVAYVQSSDIDERQLREHCQSHLPPHMIPSIFIVLDKLPLNANGKIDRKLLPPPNFSQLSSTHHTTDKEYKSPTNEIETTIHHIWCDIFQQNQISTDVNIFTIGGHSLLIMQLFHRYKTKFDLKTNTLSMADLFQHPTIADHARLIHEGVSNIQNIDDYQWSTLNLTQGIRQHFYHSDRHIFCYYFPYSSSIICPRTNLLGRANSLFIEK